MYTLYTQKSTFQDLLKLINKLNKMATKKKTTAATKPKTHTLTKEQLEVLNEISAGIASIKYGLSNLSDEKNLSTVMFNIGKLFTEVNNCEDKMDNFLGEFEDDSDDFSW